MRSAARLTMVLVAALAGSNLAQAQDAHYWTYGYGPIGQLTEGTLVGGVSDLSATYYNPGALALLDKPRFVVGLTSIELANIKVPGAAGDGLDVDQLVFDIVPSMLAGKLGGGEGANQFAFSFLSRHDSDWDLGYSQAAVSGLSSEGQAGFGRMRQRLVEYWVGGTWSHRFSDRFAAGVSPFLAYRAQRSRRSLTAEAISGAEAASAFIGSEYEYNHVRVIAKAGLAWRPGPWQLGLTVTTPGVGIWGQGKAVFNAAVTGTSLAEPFVSASAQKGLDATYRAPWSVAGGASWRGGGTAIHTTAEWFSAVGEYDILQPEPAPVAGRPDVVPLRYSGQARSVLCYGVGIEQRLSDSFVLYGGAAENESAYVSEHDSFAAWDLTDVTLGFTVQAGRALVAFGLGYAWGSSPVPQAVTPPESKVAGVLRDASIGRWTISFGASFH